MSRGGAVHGERYKYLRFTGHFSPSTLHYVSKEEGKTWTQLQPAGLENASFSLTVDPLNPERVFATTRGGLHESTSGGKDWQLAANTQKAPVVGLPLSKTSDGPVMYSNGQRTTDN